MDHFAGLDVSVKDTSICIVESRQRRQLSLALEVATAGATVNPQMRPAVGLQPRLQSLAPPAIEEL